eukprot:TRINITY_DN12502_c0_g1_i2.p1 TRINITY_DN12502_c0_g1~~TRINITY_DN12502_c0_g1_i2.p1  ORF type:complete len:1233 (+),score=284.31 TRINITY_DN12502_c0_g1_i2:2729-6427(+)
MAEPNIYMNDTLLLGSSWLLTAATAAYAIIEQNALASAVIGAIALGILVVYLQARAKQKQLRKRLAEEQRDKIRKRDVLRMWMKQAAKNVGLQKDLRTRGKTKPIPNHRLRGVTRRFMKMLRQESRANKLVPKTPDRGLLEPSDHVDEPQLPPEIQLTIKSMRIFGAFDHPVFLVLNRHIETMRLHRDQYLFRIGEADDSVYIIQEGRIELIAQHPLKPDAMLTLSELGPGEHVSSLLTVIENLAGTSSNYKTVEAKASVDNTVIIRIPMKGFQELADKHYGAYRQLVKAVTMRTQRVTFVALFRFLGLSEELTHESMHNDHSSERARTSSRTTAAQTEMECAIPDEITFESVQDLAVAKEQLLAISHIITSQLHVDDKWAEPLHQAARFKTLEVNDWLYHAGEHDTDLFFVVRGSLSGAVLNDDDRRVTMMAYCTGDFIGELSILSGAEAFLGVHATSKALLVQIPRVLVLRLLDVPAGRDALGTLIKVNMRILSPLVRQVDFALDWMHLDAGQRVFTQGETASTVYIVLSGRVRSVLTRADGSKQLIREYGRHEMVGELEVLTETPRATTVHAVRDAELAKVPAGLLHLVKHKHPKVSTHLMRLMSERLLSLVNGSDKETANTNLATIALIPVSENVPLTAFAEKLTQALSYHGSTLHLNVSSVMSLFGKHPAEVRGSEEYAFVRWLAAQEDKHKVVIYEAPFERNRWTSRCIRQADCILVVGLGAEEPSLAPAEAELEQIAQRAQKELVLLHSMNTVMPKHTADWLNLRSWCSFHHHIRCDESILCCDPIDSDPDTLLDYFLGRSQLPEDVFDDSESEDDAFSTRSSALSTRRTSTTATPIPGSQPIGVDHDTVAAVNLQKTDFGRLSRHLAGASVGVVLGGGGARGSAHLGVLRAMEQDGIPIDMIGGTSIGAFVGGMIAEELSVENSEFLRRYADFARVMGSQLNMVLDLTYPLVAFFSGRAFNRVIEDVFGDRQIEDLWIPYFCVSTDITDSAKVVHTHGSLWRYVRASMSLSGYLPPICDPENGHMLLDGGYVDVLPIEVMKQRGASTIFAVDVAGREERDLDNFGDEISGFWLLWMRMNPFLTTPKIPVMGEIASRLAFIASNKFLNELHRNKDEDVQLISPPVGTYGVLEWDKQAAIADIGYNTARPIVQDYATKMKNAIKKARNRPGSLSSPSATGMSPARMRRSMARFNSLTDIDQVMPRRQSVDARTWSTLLERRDSVMS